MLEIVRALPAFSADASGQPGVARRGDGSPARLLVVEDESLLADMLLDALSFAGYEVHVCRSGVQAMAAVEERRPDIVLLDVNMPDFDGFTVAARLRAASDLTPIIFLTARDTAQDLRRGYLSGGDDYLTKPFRLEELRLRIEAVLRRTLDGRDAETTRFEVGDLVLETRAHQVWRTGEEIELSATEFRLLTQLIRNVDKVLSRADLLRQVWGMEFDSDTSLVETYISYLRRKLDTREPRLIRTVRGVGYVLRRPRE